MIIQMNFCAFINYMYSYTDAKRFDLIGFSYPVVQIVSETDDILHVLFFHMYKVCEFGILCTQDTSIYS